MLIEIYNQNGDLILDNETNALKCVFKASIAGGYNVPMSITGGNLPVGTWYTSWQFYGVYEGDRLAKTDMIQGPFNNQIPEHDVSWVMPLEGTTVAHSIMLNALSCVNNKYVVKGTGCKYAYTKKGSANDVSGYLDCYDQNGKLLWSANSLIKCPQILKVVNANLVRTIDLTEFDPSLRDNIYLSSTFTGDFFDDGVVANASAVNFTRKGNLIKIGSFENGNSVNAHIMVAYIPDP